MSVNPTDTLVQRLGDRFKTAVQESSDFRGDLSVVIEPGALVDVARYLKAEEGFDYLLYATAVDWPARDPRFTVVWEVRSLAGRATLRGSCERQAFGPDRSAILPRCGRDRARAARDRRGHLAERTISARHAVRGI